MYFTVLRHNTTQNRAVGCIYGTNSKHTMCCIAVGTVNSQWVAQCLRELVVGCSASVKVEPPRALHSWSRFRPQSWDPLHSTLVCLFCAALQELRSTAQRINLSFMSPALTAANVPFASNFHRVGFLLWWRTNLCPLFCPLSLLASLSVLMSTLHDVPAIQSTKLEVR